MQAGQESELHRLEQQAMLRHPNIVRTTIAAEMSWKQGNTMEIAKVGWMSVGVDGLLFSDKDSLQLDSVLS